MTLGTSSQPIRSLVHMFPFLLNVIPFNHLSIKKNLFLKIVWKIHLLSSCPIYQLFCFGNSFPLSVHLSKCLAWRCDSFITRTGGDYLVPVSARSINMKKEDVKVVVCFKLLKTFMILRLVFYKRIVKKICCAFSIQMFILLLWGFDR